MDAGVDETVDGRWMTHAELAQARGISTASAIKLALRHRWRKQKDNRGTLRCLVPMEFTNPKPLRANEDETWRCREFRLEGAEG
jgi:hypothetical protein